ncbi:MAG: hypothetical protein PHD11_09530 [Bacteroidales bacterium]|nr:hypothetical protein [Bacteroidales bacterium]MDD4670549.1 hypothetical protein [Bacteroidales bacterium]
MDINLLNNCIKSLIVDNDNVGIPGLGMFVAEMMPASYSDDRTTINPPYRKLTFHRCQLSDKECSKLIEEVSQKSGKSIDDAVSDIRKCAERIADELDSGQIVSIPGLGTLQTTNQNDMLFTVEDGANLYPDGLGLEPIHLKEIRKQHESNTDDMNIGNDGKGDNSGKNQSFYISNDTNRMGFDLDDISFDDDDLDEGLNDNVSKWRRSRRSRDEGSGDESSSRKIKVGSGRGYSEDEQFEKDVADERDSNKSNSAEQQRLDEKSRMAEQQREAERERIEAERKRIEAEKIAERRRQEEEKIAEKERIEAEKREEQLRRVEEKRRRKEEKQMERANRRKRGNMEDDDYDFLSDDDSPIFKPAKPFNVNHEPSIKTAEQEQPTVSAGTVKFSERAEQEQPTVSAGTVKSSERAEQEQPTGAADPVKTIDSTESVRSAESTEPKRKETASYNFDSDDDLPRFLNKGKLSLIVRIIIIVVAILIGLVLFVVIVYAFREQLAPFSESFISWFDKLADSILYTKEELQLLGR